MKRIFWICATLPIVLALGGCPPAEDDDTVDTGVDLCASANCAEGESCDPTTGLCVPDSSGDLCDDVTCDSGEVCEEGQCMPDDTGDPCDDVTCGADEICEEGLCVPEDTGDLCDDVTCDSGEVCAEGQCVPDDIGDPCDDVTCDTDEVCEEGLCVPDDVGDPCEGVECDIGEVCEEGLCVPDDVGDPCDGVECDPGEVCVEGTCEGGMTGAASLSFEPQFAVGVEFAQDWRAGFNGGDRLVFMLCAMDDPTCEAPVLLRAVEDTETDGDPIQNSFGPSITLEGLPAGNYRFMVVADSEESQALGLAWDDDFGGDAQWGGVVSETDVMLQPEGWNPGDGRNPPPEPVTVSLTDGVAAELGVVKLGHWYQRDIFPTMQTEEALIAVGTTSGVRVMDMSVWPWAMVEVFPGGFYEYIPQDANGNVYPGEVCNVLSLGGTKVLVIMPDASRTADGLAFEIDITTGEQGNTVTFPSGGAPANPCGASIVEDDGDRFLFASDPGLALFYANITDLVSGDVTAGRVEGNGAGSLMERLVFAGIRTRAAHQGTLYMGLVPDNSGETALQIPGVAETRAVFAASYDATGALSPLESDGALTHWIAGSRLDDVQSPTNGEIDCFTNFGVGSPGLAVATFQPTGHNLLFVGGCSQIWAYDLDDGMRKLDFNGPAPGSPGLDITAMGHNVARFQLSPDGETLWAIPGDKSRMVYSIQKGDGSRGLRTDTNRYMLIPISLTEGAQFPQIASAFNQINHDDFEGEAGLNNMVTPAADPGLDINYISYLAYARRFMADAPLFVTSAYPIPRSIVVTAHTMFVEGSASSAGGDLTSGLGKGGNLMTIDLAEQRQYLWPHNAPDDPFYMFFLGGATGLTPFGYDLTPNVSEMVQTRGLVYVPLQ